MQFRIISIFFIAILNNLIGQIPFTENERKQGYKEIDGSVYFIEIQVKLINSELTIPLQFTVDRG